jgi:SAM-dependent methyltransferase
VMSSRYRLENAAAEAEQRFWTLESLFDDATSRRLQALGLGPGWTCLEVGAGGGSVARWLADRVTPGGCVVATDLDPRLTRTGGRRNLEVRRHDISCDPIPDSHFDLIHARLVLVHLQDRLAILNRLVAALRPGGFLVLEEFTDLDRRGQLFLRGSADTDVETLRRVHVAFSDFLAAGGADFAYPWQVPNLFAERGLVDIGAEGDWRFCRGGTAGAELMKANLEQLRDPLIDAGLISSSEAQRFLAAMDDPDVLFTLPVLVRSWGRRGE